MANINDEGNVTVCCPGCNGSLSTYEWQTAASQYGVVTKKHWHGYRGDVHADFRLYRCAGCGRGGLGEIVYGSGSWLDDGKELSSFYPESKERLELPKDVPEGIVKEFREGEVCFENKCLRAAAGMFRSVLDKTLRANGYKEKMGIDLCRQIDAAASDGVITESRKRRAHEEIRVLGNDVLHDEWHLIPEEDVKASRHYIQRILEDFYDDRESVLKFLRDAGRVPDEDKKEAESDSAT